MSMGIKKNQAEMKWYQPLDEVTKPSFTKKSVNVKSGNLAGENLQVSHQTTSTQSPKSTRPTLEKPDKDLNFANDEAVMNSMSQLFSDWDHITVLVESLLTEKTASHKMVKTPVPESLTVYETDRGFSGILDDQRFDVDIADKSMQFTAGGKQIHLQFGQNGNLQSAKADAVPFKLSNDEVGAINHFFMLMALFYEMGIEQRQIRRQNRNLASKAAIAKMKQQAGEQRSAAASRLVAGAIGGTVNIVSGGLNMYGTVKGMKANAAAAPGTHPGDAIVQQWMAIGKVTESTGNTGASVAQHSASIHDAYGVELRAEEEQARFVKQTEQDQMQIANDLLMRARDAFSQTLNQYLQTQSGIIRNI